jgi:hypothetical protein
MAGEATAVAAAPAAETFKKSRRFIQSLLETGVSHNCSSVPPAGEFHVFRGALAGL